MTQSSSPETGATDAPSTPADVPGNPGASRPRAVPAARQELEALAADFVAWLAPRERRFGAACWSAMRADARRLAASVADTERLGLDLGERALLALLPYDDRAELRSLGAFCHVLPGLARDPRASFSDAGWTAPEDWAALSRSLFLFVRRCDENPGELWQACHEFVALPGSRGFDSALLSPMLNALRPDDFLIVNAATRAALNHFTGSAFGAALSEYPEAQAATRRFIETSRELLLTHAPPGMRLGDCFAVFSHWLMNERLPAGETAFTPADADPPQDGPALSMPLVLSAGDVPEPAAGAIAPGIAPCPKVRPRGAAAAQAAVARAAAAEAAAALASVARPAAAAVAQAAEATAAVTQAAEAPAAVAATTAAPALAEPDTIPSTAAAPVAATPVAPAPVAAAPVASAPIATAPMAPVGVAASTDAAPVAATVIAAADVARPVRGVDATPEAAIAQAFAPRDETPASGLAASAVPAGAVPASAVSANANPDSAVAAPEPEDPAAAALARLVAEAARRGQLLLCGRPGSGTAAWAEAVARELRSADGLSERLVFHAGWTRGDFLQNVDAHGNRRAGRFTEFCRRAAERKGRSVLLIHALQRANAAAVFAEALELLDLRDVECSLSGSGSLAVPRGLALVAGSETADGLPPDEPDFTQHFACAAVPELPPPAPRRGPGAH